MFRRHYLADMMQGRQAVCLPLSAVPPLLAYLPLRVFATVDIHIRQVGGVGGGRGQMLSKLLVHIAVVSARRRPARPRKGRRGSHAFVFLVLTLKVP